MRRDDAIRLRHMLDAAREALRFAEGRHISSRQKRRQTCLASLRLVYAYFDINLDIFWQTVVEDLPILVPLLEPSLPPEVS